MIYRHRQWGDSRRETYRYKQMETVGERQTDIDKGRQQERQ